MSAIYTLGIDVGSTASKCIILKDGTEIIAKSPVSYTHLDVYKRQVSINIV